MVDEDEVSPPRELPAHGPSKLPSLAQRVYTLTASYTRSCFEHRAPDIVVPTLTTVPFRPRFPDHLPPRPLNVARALHSCLLFPRNVTFTPGFVIRRMPMPPLFIANDGCLLHSLCGVQRAFFLYIPRLAIVRVSKVSLRGCNVTVDL